MNTAVAAIERGESRAMPQTPWPLVQPEPKVTPTPTIRPPMTRSPVETGTANGTVPPAATNATGARIAPARKARRHELAVSKGEKTPDRMPLSIFCLKEYGCWIKVWETSI